MKKIKYLIIIVSVMIFASCSEDFLTEKPVDDIFAENLLVNHDGFLNMQNAMFGLVRDEYDRGDRFYGGTSFGSIPFTKHTLFSAGADNSWGNNRHTNFRHLSFPKNITDMEDVIPFQAVFEWLYKVINTSNMIISRAEYEGIDWQGSTAEEDLANKNTVIANARLVRAWAYRHLTYSFGAVPL
ncbi:MAG TPA: RagB/SusD family nutrient uptake outer membrane protein, partial [Bacteroidales bacterium]|nr:RagB/SusD family nutrient uptake outer membrane protein [Bacteroidales bacterium]